MHGAMIKRKTSVLKCHEEMSSDGLSQQGSVKDGWLVPVPAVHLSATEELLCSLELISGAFCILKPAFFTPPYLQ